MPKPGHPAPDEAADDVAGMIPDWLDGVVQ